MSLKPDTTPTWFHFREALMGLDGKSLWITAGGKRTGPYRIAILPDENHGERRYALELIPSLPDESRRLYLRPEDAGKITPLEDDNGKYFELIFPSENGAS